MCRLVNKSYLSEKGHSWHGGGEQDTANSIETDKLLGQCLNHSQNKAMPFCKYC